MNDAIWAALIGGGGTIAGAVLAEVIRTYSASRPERGNALASLKGRWQCQWHVQDSGSSSSLYSEDIVTVERVRGNRFYGTAVDRLGKYSVEGQVSTSNIVTLYTYGNGRNSGLSAVALLRLEPRKERMEGTWMGYTHQGVVQSGQVVWTEIQDK